MTVIFLDIDGVLNNMKTCGLPAVFPTNNRFETYLNPISIDYVNQLAEKHNAQIVMSASRELDKENNVGSYLDTDIVTFDLKDFLRRSGLNAKFHEDWQTPVSKKLSQRLYGGLPRGQEIQSWLYKHPEVKKWVAIDDDIHNFDLEQKAWLASCDPSNGFLKDEFKVADSILSMK